MDKFVNLVKLSVGSENVETMVDWQATRAAQADDGLPRHVTRMWPKRAPEILRGGSIYWVIKGAIQCRQRILRLDEVIGADGIRRCAIVMEPAIFRTQTTLRRPFQGWRYLNPEDSPVDLRNQTSTADDLPDELANALAEIGVR